MTKHNVSELTQKKQSQQAGKDSSKSPGAGDHKSSDQQARIPQGGRQVQPGQSGVDGDREAKGGSGQHK